MVVWDTPGLVASTVMHLCTERLSGVDPAEPEGSEARLRALGFSDSEAAVGWSASWGRRRSAAGGSATHFESRALRGDGGCSYE